MSLLIFLAGVAVGAVVILVVMAMRRRGDNVQTLEVAPPRLSPATPPSAGAAELYGAGSYEVVLTDCGPNKINVIKLVREYTDLGLKEAKDLSEQTPSIIVRAVSATEAARMQRELLDAGGKAEVRAVG